ncbi:hypothetical protein [Desmospora activa]|uniref:Uncharacterized protein n=1 Tax=Desmospora activa DSM 45169 TaxID=1121389 RepID=A0A2T4Z471_9BACL|nr:hypothetical protein [Desmospora activa]PTM56677.1 hypothetical protein C8J48_3002 [Desmospora activa DSM 45169]
MINGEGMEGIGLNRTKKVVTLFAAAALVAVPGCSSSDSEASEERCVDKNRDGYCDEEFCIDNDEDGYCDDGTDRAGGASYYSGGNRYFQKESGITPGSKSGYSKSKSKGGIGKSSSSGLFSGG